MMNPLRHRKAELENITLVHQLVYSFLIFLGVWGGPSALAALPDSAAAHCQERLAPTGEQAIIIFRTPRERDEIVRFHRVYAEGAVLEFKIYTSSDKDAVVPGHLKDIALLLNSRFPKVSEAILTHGHRVSVEFIRPEQP